MGILCKDRPMRRLLERIVRPARRAGDLCSSVKICGARRRRPPLPWAWHCPARGPEPPANKTCPYHQYGSNRARLDPFRPLTLPVAVPVRPGPEPRHDRLRRPARWALTSQRRKTGRQRATEAIARPGHPDAGKRQDAHGTAEPPAIARRHQAGYAGGRHPRLHSRSRRKPGETARRPQQPGGALEHAVPAGADRDHNRPARLARMAVAYPGLPDRHGDLGGPGAGPALDHPTPGTPPRGSQYSAQPVAAELLWMAAVQLAPWAIAFVITLYLSVAPDSVGQLGALVLAYAAAGGAVLVAVADLPDAAGRPAPHPGAGHPAPARAAAAMADRQPGRAGRFAAIRKS